MKYALKYQQMKNDVFFYFQFDYWIHTPIQNCNNNA